MSYARADAVLWGLAENPALPTDLALRLVAHCNGHGRVAKRADLDAQTIAAILAGKDARLTHNLALNRAVPSSVRATLAGHADPLVRVAVAVVAGSEGAPRGLVERLIGDADPRVRTELARSEHVPADLRARLAEDEDAEVRAVLAKTWPQAPEPVRRRLLGDSVGAVRGRYALIVIARSEDDDLFVQDQIDQSMLIVDPP